MSSLATVPVAAACAGRAVLSILLLSLTAAAIAEEPPRPAAAAPDLSSIVGIYAADGPHGRVVVSPRRLGEGIVPVFTSLGTGAIRALFPGEDGSLVAGATVARPEPVAFRLSFDGSGDLTLHDVDSGAAWSARKLPLLHEEVDFRGAGDVVLRGTLHRPASGAGPLPGVALAGGSEDAGDRHAFDALPYVLAERGFAVLAFDKRGTGDSDGSWDVDHSVLAADLAAAVEWLAGRDEVGETVGVIGFSEGSWIAPLAAAGSATVDFIVALSGGGLPKAESFLHRERGELEEEGLRGEALEEAFALRRMQVEEAGARIAAGEPTSPWDLRMTHDPAPEWRRFRGPVLALFGEWDTIVPAVASAERLRQILAAARHPDFQVVLFPRAHHSLFLGRTGAPSEFARMEGLAEYAPGYWQTLLLWLDRVAGAREAQELERPAADVNGAIPAAAEREETPEAVVVREAIAAFNAHDPEAFAALCAEDARWLGVAGDSVSVDGEGRGSIRDWLVGYFESLPDVRSEVAGLTQSGNHVAFRERVTWTARDGARRTQEALAVYEVGDGEIRRAWYFSAP